MSELMAGTFTLLSLRTALECFWLFFWPNLGVHLALLAELSHFTNLAFIFSSHIKQNWYFIILRCGLKLKILRFSFSRNPRETAVGH